MATTRSRQRKLARDKYERQQVRRAQKQRRRRQIQAGVGVFLVIGLVVAGTAWLAGWFESEPEPAAAPDRCLWQPLDAAGMPDRVDVGTPPANPPEEGTRTMSVDLTAGPGDGTVQVAIAVANDPCAAASMEHLAAQGFYDGTDCHELTDGSALRCGDPGGNGVGGPTYAFFGTNVPEPADEEPATNGDGPPVAYPRGTVAMADDSGLNSSQFLIFFEDYHVEEPFWPIVGEVTSGLDVVEAIGDAGTAGESTAPADPVQIRTLTVTDPDADSGSGLDES